MADEETTTDQTDGGVGKDQEEDNRPDDTLAEGKTCPECGTPVDDVRATCINCGYEYSEDDHEDPEAGNEFLSGSQVDEQGDEVVDQEPEADEAGEEQEKSE